MLVNDSFPPLDIALYSQKELQNEEKEHNKRIRGFREVIDLISASQKPVVVHNSLNGQSLSGKFCSC